MEEEEDSINGQRVDKEENGLIREGMGLSLMIFYNIYSLYISDDSSGCWVVQTGPCGGFCGRYPSNN